ncbi:securin-like isoform X1 [Phyllobates terribilis]|uniref:securin-like isoform X1 n=1 Tax=Phyllobates terribilis TaxID=111132 RepID=UPI003CCB2C12
MDVRHILQNFEDSTKMNLTIMATVIYSDQENGDVNAALLSRDRAQLSGAGKSLVKSHQGKVRSSASSGKTSRKALGNVNKQVMTQKNGQPLKGDRKVPKPAPAVIQVSGSSDKTDEQQYPDIEKFVPYNPAGGCDGVLGLLLRFHPVSLVMAQ